MLLHEDDLVISVSTPQHVRAVLGNKRRTSELTKTGRGQWVIPNNAYIEMDDTLSSATIARFMTAYSKHAEYIIENVKALALRFDVSSSDRYQSILIDHAGISSKWLISEFDEFVGVGYKFVEQRYNRRFRPAHQGYGQTYWAFDSIAPKDSSIISESYVAARMALMTSQLGSFSWSKDKAEQTFWARTTSITIDGASSKGNFLALSGVYETELAYKLLTEPVAGGLVINQRNLILSARQRDASDRERVARQLSRDNFTKYWSSLKRVVKDAVDVDEVKSAWATIPIQPTGTLASRTWGIEIETVQADKTSRPLGWDERSDGSLEPIDYNCECGCEDCEDPDTHCGYDDCYDSEGSCAEFVSPILRYFNSQGLMSLCSDLENLPVNTTPGIHVHVDGNDLTVTDVARLIRAYSVVSSFIAPLTQRKVTNYCKDVTTDNLAHWLGASRAMRKQMSSDKAVDVTYHQPDDRYHDLNLQALRAHGTIEFRVMGPIYNYDHLVRWAWFCREMVNVSRLDLPQTTWTAVRSMADVLAILTKYGSESTPESWLDPTAFLDAEHNDESAND